MRVRIPLWPLKNKETMTTNKEIQTIDDVPTTEHWQLIQFESRRIDDGYGGDCNITIPKISIFNSLEELEKQVLKIQSDKYCQLTFFVQKVFGRAEIVTTVKVKIQ